MAIALILIMLRRYRMLAGEDGCPGMFTRLIQVAGILLHHTIRLDKWNQSALAWLEHLKMLQYIYASFHHPAGYDFKAKSNNKNFS